jgi:long-chain acyl-CoA synthetase
MIVTEGGKNVYPEDIESAFEGIAVKEHCIFAANYIWPQKELGREALVLVVHPDLNQEFTRTIKEDITSRNRGLPDYKRVGGYVVWDKDFPRTASMKIKRAELADEIRNSLDRTSAVKEH